MKKYLNKSSKNFKSAKFKLLQVKQVYTKHFDVVNVYRHKIEYLPTSTFQ